MTESFAIIIYLVKKYNRLDLIGADKNDHISEARVHQVVGVIKDTAKEMGGLCFNPEFNTVKDALYESKLSLMLNVNFKYLYSIHYFW